MFTSRKPQPYVMNVRDDAEEELIARQLAFERDSMSVDNAARYFKELNRRGDYAKVKSLWNTYEVEYLGAVAKERNAAYEQYQYAVRNASYLKKALGDNSSSSKGPSAGRATSNSSWSGWNTTTLFRGLGWLMKTAVLWVLPAYFIVQMIRGIGGDRGFGEMKKFDIKMAGNIEQRLDEVKGIDEIKEEILNIIRII